MNQAVCRLGNCQKIARDARGRGVVTFDLAHSDHLSGRRGVWAGGQGDAVEMSEKPANLILDARFVLLKESGYLPSPEKPDRVGSLPKDWLGKIH